MHKIELEKKVSLCMSLDDLFTYQKYSVSHIHEVQARG